MDSRKLRRWILLKNLQIFSPQNKLFCENSPRFIIGCTQRSGATHVLYMPGLARPSWLEKKMLFFHLFVHVLTLSARLLPKCPIWRLRANHVTHACIGIAWSWKYVLQLPLFHSYSFYIPIGMILICRHITINYYVYVHCTITFKKRSI